MNKTTISFLAIFAIIASLLLISCSKEEKNEINDNNGKLKSIQDGYSAIAMAAEQHNKALDYIYTELQNAKDKKILDFTDKSAILSFVDASLTEFIQNNEVPDVVTNSALALDIYHQLNFDGSQTAESFYTQSQATHLSAKQIELLDDLNDAIDPTSLSNTLSAWQYIGTRAENECSGNDKYIVLAAISIGSASFDYWENNMDKWRLLLENSSRVNWGGVGRNDIAGGVGAGVTYGVYALLIPPFGWGALGASVLAGAAGASAATIIAEW